MFFFKEIKDNNLIFTACNQLLTCDTCTKEAATINFDCSWCSDIDRCSSGIDRHREEWVENKCDLSVSKRHFKGVEICMNILGFKVLG